MDETIVKILESYGCKYMAEDNKEMIKEIQTYIIDREQQQLNSNNMDNDKIVLEIYEALRIESVSSRLEFVFFDKKHAVKLPNKTRALVKHKDGFIEMAVWLGKKYGWCDEGSYSNCGGIGGDITDDVVEFALNGC